MGLNLVLGRAEQPGQWGVMESSGGRLWAPGQGGVGFLWLDVSDIHLLCGHGRIPKASQTEQDCVLLTETLSPVPSPLSVYLAP